MDFSKLRLSSIFGTKQGKAYKEAEKFLGLAEVMGSKHEPKILQFFAEVGHSWVKDDETAWCAAFVGAMLKRAGLPHTGKLNARSYIAWGEEVEDWNDFKQGDIVIFWRNSKDSVYGHVAFFHSWDENGDFHVLGGNQGNKVSIKTYAKERFLSARRWKE